MSTHCLCVREIPVDLLTVAFFKSVKYVITVGPRLLRDIRIDRVCRARNEMPRMKPNTFLRDYVCLYFQFNSLNLSYPRAQREFPSKIFEIPSTERLARFLLLVRRLLL